MKRTLLYAVFFMFLFTGVAQQKSSTFFVPLRGVTDTLELAKNLLKEGIRVGTTDTSLSFSLLHKAALIFRKAGNTLAEGKCHLALGDIFFEAGNYNRSFGNYLKASDILYEVSQKESCRAKMGIAKTQYHRGLYRFAIKAFSEVVEYGVQNNDNELKSIAYEYLGLIYSILQSPKESIPYFIDALSTNQKMNDKKGSLRIAEKLYDLYYKDKQFDSSLWYSNLTLALANSLNYEASIILSTLNRIASLIRLKKLSEAKKELDDFSTIPVPRSDMNTRLRYEIICGNYYLIAQNAEKATKHYNAAIALAEEQNTPDQLGLVYSNMADSYSDLSDYKTAYRYAVMYNEIMNNFYVNSISHLSKIEGLFKENVAATEIKYLNSINKLKEIKILREQELRRNLLEESYLKDSILKKEKLLSNALERENISQSKQLLSQQQLGNYLKQESQLQKEKLSEAQRVRMGLIIGICSVITLGTLAWYQYRRVKTKKEIIQKQSHELQTLMKEIHHRVKNNLQIISSLLDIQSLSLADKQAVEAIKEGRNRVQSMAILHQHLYHEGNIRGIKMHDYINTLIQNLFSSYNINPDKIIPETDIDTITLDVDTVIPLGLIINELVSNSLKYAFGKDQPGKIRISLKEKKEMIELIVQDTGRGFPVGLNIHNEQTFGLQLINAFAQKLKATLEFYNNNGAVASIQIKKFRLA